MGFLSSIAGSLIGGAFGLLGDRRSADSASDAGAQNAALQREFAKHGVRWRVEDAKKAGINPLFALGAPVMSASPSYVGSESTAFANFGQDLSRAMHATRTDTERAEAFADLQLENARLQNDVLRTQIASQIAKVSQAGGNPPMPSIGDSGRVVVDPSRRTSTLSGNPATEAAISPANKLFVNADGSIVAWPSADAKQSIEDTPYEWEHLWRNRLSPWLSGTWGKLWNLSRGVPTSRSPY